jgi:predicted RNA-binding Zn-ribbon protein involved in translation (DUF1610 family)
MRPDSPTFPSRAEPRWIRDKRVLIRHVGIWALAVLVSLPIVAGVVTWSWTRSVQITWEISGMGAFASFGGIVALGVTRRCAHRCRRPLDNLDVVRMVCWMAVSGGFCSACWYNPLSGPMVLGGLLVIGLTSVAFKPPQPPPPGFCRECGYDLTGNVSGVCPECGEVVARQDSARTTSR